jgi:hypothetical protein
VLESRGWKLVDQQVLSADTASVTINPSFAGYRLVKITAYLRIVRVSVAQRTVLLQMNGETGADYDWVRINRTGSTSGGANANADTSIVLGTQAGGTGTTDISGLLEMTVNVTGGFRSVLWTFQGTPSGGTAPEVTTGSGYLRKTGDLTSLLFFNTDANFSLRSGSTFVVEAI